MTRNNTKDFDEAHMLIHDTVQSVQAEMDRGKLLISSGLMGKRTTGIAKAVVDAKLLFVAIFQARCDGVSMGQLVDALNSALPEDIKVREHS